MGQYVIRNSTVQFKKMDYVQNPKLYFQKFDVNNDGKLSTEELMPALQSIGYNPTKADVKRIMDAADDNGDGKIDYDSEEFVSLLQELEDEPYDKVMAAFKHFDKDGNGSLDAAELKSILTTMGDKLTEEQADQLLQMADQNGDGVIDYSEFVQIHNFTAPILQ